MWKMVLLTILQIVMQVERLSIRLFYCSAVDWSLFNSIHACQSIKMYVPLKSKYIARHHYMAWRKPKKRFLSIIASKFLWNQQQSPVYLNHMSSCHFDIWIKKVNYFRLNSCLASLITNIHREYCYLWVRLPTLLGVSPIPSPLCLCLFGNVGSGSMHPLGFVT